jgi:hypothetical protein
LKHCCDTPFVFDTLTPSHTHPPLAHECILHNHTVCLFPYAHTSLLLVPRDVRRHPVYFSTGPTIGGCPTYCGGINGKNNSICCHSCIVPTHTHTQQIQQDACITLLPLTLSLYLWTAAVKATNCQTSTETPVDDDKRLATIDSIRTDACAYVDLFVCAVLL